MIPRRPLVRNLISIYPPTYIHTLSKYQTSVSYTISRILPIHPFFPYHVEQYLLHLRQLDRGKENPSNFTYVSSSRWICKYIYNPFTEKETLITL
jgi:hypothetical protein